MLKPSENKMMQQAQFRHANVDHNQFFKFGCSQS